MTVKIISKANDCDRGLAAYMFTTDYAQVIFGFSKESYDATLHNKRDKKKREKRKKENMKLDVQT